MTTLTAGASAPAGGGSSASDDAALPDQHVTRSRAGDRVKEAVLTAVGILGLLAIAWLVCAWLFGLSIVVFKTGSMSPTIPTGAAAVVREIPASDIALGDVITVERTAELPITHRVVDIQPGTFANSRIVTLKGDANSTADLEPYTLTEAKVVLASMPGAGTVLAIVRTPLVLALTTLAVALLCVWAFWPKRRAVPTASETATAVPTASQPAAGASPANDAESS